MSLDAAVSALVQRLETVTSRLESVERQLASGAPASGGAVASVSASAGDSSASVAEFEDLITTHVVPLVNATNQLGTDELKKIVALFQNAVQAERDFLKIAASSKKPDQASIQKLIEPISKLMTEISSFRDSQRKSKQFNHLSTISEGIGALGWVVVEPTPAPFVNEARASSEFYSNKILVEFKKTNPEQVQWVHHYNEFLKDLAAYVKKNHTTGLVWNPQGGEAKAVAAPKAAGGPPPPPAAGPPPPVADAPTSSKSGPDTGALFAAINKGGAITSGLKKVDKSQMTHKNPELRGSSVVPAAESKPKPAAKAAATGVKKGTPKFELQDKKWVVEWQENNQNLQITETELRHTVYIYKCEKSVVQISGKVNSITLDGCKRVSVVFSDAVAQVELINCTGCEVQITGKVPSVAIDKCSGIQVYLSKTGLDTEVVSSKSDSMNVLIPDPAGGPDPVEIAIPEQYKTTVVNGKLSTSAVEHV